MTKKHLCYGVPSPWNSEDFVLLVLTCAWLVLGPLCDHEEWQLVEFFSGTGRLSRLAAKAGIRTASFEILLDHGFKERRHKNKHVPKRSYMDFCGECGFALLGPS